ncbi:MAG: rRNA adenine N-6-methyltransferase family protein, partial [Phycisphaerae bacterium]|nr:rRNA adenine N-6-methyltransferase family protein [Phycisphaerae bacterium]
MQTKTEIQKLLSSIGAEPNRRLGQNFLIDLNLMHFLLTNSHINPNDVVFEVGTGTGSLTRELIQRAARVVAVEYDDNLAKITAGLFAKEKSFKLINADVLENKNTINQEVIKALKEAMAECSGKVLLVANLPYNVASSVMANLLTGEVV